MKKMREREEKNVFKIFTKAGVYAQWHDLMLIHQHIAL